MAIDFTSQKQLDISLDAKITIGVIAGSVVLAILLSIVTTMPINAKIKENKSRLNLIRSVNLSSVNVMAKEETKLLTEKERVDTEFDELKIMLTKKRDVSNLIDSFLLTAKERNLTFNSIQPLPGKLIYEEEKDKANSRSRGRTKDDEPRIPLFEETVMGLELDASFADFLVFLWDTEKLDRTLRLKSLNVLTNTSTGIHRYRMVISVFKYLGKQDEDK